MSNRLFRALDGSSRSSIPSQHSRDSTLKTFRPPQRRLERLRVEGSSKLRKLCARWAVIAAKTLVMMTLSAVFLSVLPIKNLYKAAAKLPVYKAKTTPRVPATTPKQAKNQGSPNRYSHLINFTLAVCDKETSTQSVACFFPGR